MPPTSRTTKGGTPKLSEQARHLVVPQGIVATGWPAVRRTCVDKLGIAFDPWQEGAGRVILAKREDGHLASMIDGVGMSLPRQVGKTYLIAATIFALCVNTPGLLVIWTAHHGGTSSETFLALQGFSRRARIAPHVRQVFTGSGDEEIRFHNGSRILFGAREHGFGRGIPGVDVLIFDEAQILSDKAMSNMLATMNTSRFGLQLYVGTPPKPEDVGRSETFRRMRAQALAGTLLDGAWIEFGADPDADLDDHAQWRKANPSFPKRTPVQSMLRLKRKLTPADWRREGLGIWDDDAVLRVIPAAVWAARAMPNPGVLGPPCYAVDMAPDRTVAAIGVAARSGERIHVEAVKHGSCEGGTRWIVDWLADRTDGRPPVLVDARSPAAALVPDLKAVGVNVVLTGAADMAAACGGFYDRVVADVPDGGEPALSHFDQPVLNRALDGAKKRPIQGSEGAWGWDRRDGTDITTLVAVTLAAYGLTAKTKKPKTGRAVFA